MNLHVLGWVLAAAGVIAGMCGAGYLLACIVLDKLLNGR